MTKKERLLKIRRLNLLGYKALRGVRTPEEDKEAQKLMEELDNS